MKRSPLKRKPKKASGEGVVFAKIWEERTHICTNCNVYLGETALAHFFSHIKSKKMHKELMLEESNIELLCRDCHYAWEFQGIEKFNKLKK